MSEVTSPTNHWAILIGVGINIDRSQQIIDKTIKDRSLKGAVEDVNAISKYLLSCETTGRNVVKLTATKSENDDDSGQPLEDGKFLPTYTNVVRHLQTVIANGQFGDSVYIHYSGHGTRRPHDKAVALALFDPGDRGTKYLYGTILRSAIGKMITKGMAVTLVLDCCFAASVLRDDDKHGTRVRFIEFDESVEAQSDIEDPFMSYSTPGTRSGDIGLNVLLDTNSYTIFCASGPGETAWEIEFTKGHSRGIFSYFLLESLTSLKRYAVRTNSRSLIQHISARIRARCLSQNPILYGKSAISFFTGLDSHLMANLVSVTRNWQDNRLELSAGQAHGVHLDDEYEVYPFDQPEGASPTSKDTEDGIFRVKVTATGSLTSQVIIMSSSDSDVIIKGSSWNAALRKSFSTQKIKVCLKPSVPNRQEILKLVQCKSFLSLFAEEEHMSTPMFQVSVDNQSAYQVENAISNKVLRLPRILCGLPNSQQSLMNILEHVATFKYFQGISNGLSNAVFERSFTLDCETSSGADGCLHAQDGTRLNFSFKNHDGQLKYLTIFNFTANWEVWSLIAKGGHGECLPMPADSADFALPLTMRCEHAPSMTEDIFMFMVTSQPTSFPMVILPKIGEGDRSCPVRLEECLQALDQITAGTRFDNGENWSTRTFIVKTTPSRDTE